MQVIINNAKNIHLEVVLCLTLHLGENGGWREKEFRMKEVENFFCLVCGLHPDRYRPSCGQWYVLWLYCAASGVFPMLQCHGSETGLDLQRGEKWPPDLVVYSTKNSDQLRERNVVSTCSPWCVCMVLVCSHWCVCMALVCSHWGVCLVLVHTGVCAGLGLLTLLSGHSSGLITERCEQC